MKITEIAAFPPEIRAELEQAIRRAMSGIRDLQAMQEACERMDRTREKLRKQHGEMNISVDLVRQGRDEE